MGLFPDTTRRHLEPELMDSPTLAAGPHREALRGLARINAVSRSSAAIWSSLRTRWNGDTPGRRRVLDLACGGGDVAVALARRATRDRVELKVDGCDVNAQAVALAKARAPGLEFFRLDALGDPLPEGYDAIVCNLFLHHLTREHAVELLRKMSEAAPTLVVNDLARGPAGYAAALVGTRLLSRSPIVHVDGPRSVRSAFTLDEARELARGAGLDAVVQPVFPWRWLMVGSR